MSKIPGSAHANLTLGGLAIAGGAAGYVRRGSTASLGAGVAAGSLFLASGYLIAKTDRVFEGHVLASGTAGFAALGMGQRYLSTAGKFMPAGLVTVVGVAACAYNASKAVEWAPSSSSSGSTGSK